MKVSEELVADLASFFWSKVRKAMIEMKGPDIYIPAFGTMKIKPWKLDEVIEKYENMIRSHDGRVERGEKITFGQFASAKEARKVLERAYKAKETILANESKKKKIKDKRNGKGTKESAEEQEADPGRDS